MNLILFGFKGCGKTFFGKKCAEKLGRLFIDTDDCVKKLYGHKGRDVGQIYTELGETLFRALEKQALFSLKDVRNAVIAVGGGAVLDPENVAFLQTTGRLVYLKTSYKTLKQRMKQCVEKKGAPPILGRKNKDWEASFKIMAQQRTPIYESIVSSVVDAENLDEAKVLILLESITTTLTV